MSVEEVSLYFLGGDPIPYFGLVPIDPRSSFIITIPVIQSVEAIFRLSTPGNSDHQVCTMCHVYHVSEHEQQKDVSHVFRLLHNLRGGITLIEYH